MARSGSCNCAKIRQQESYSPSSSLRGVTRFGLDQYIYSAACAVASQQVLMPVVCSSLSQVTKYVEREILNHRALMHPHIGENYEHCSTAAPEHKAKGRPATNHHLQEVARSVLRGKTMTMYNFVCSSIQGGVPYTSLPGHCNGVCSWWRYVRM